LFRGAGSAALNQPESLLAALDEHRFNALAWTIRE
jgi:hypothetical protein